MGNFLVDPIQQNKSPLSSLVTRSLQFFWLENVKSGFINISLVIISILMNIHISPNTIFNININMEISTYGCYEISYVATAWNSWDILMFPELYYSKEHSQGESRWQEVANDLRLLWLLYSSPGLSGTNKTINCLLPMSGSQDLTRGMSGLTSNYSQATRLHPKCMGT